MILKSRRQSLKYSDKGRAVVQEQRVLLTLRSRAHLPSAQEEEEKHHAIVAWRGINKREGGTEKVQCSPEPVR